jgi:hypothetical protein
MHGNTETIYTSSKLKQRLSTLPKKMTLRKMRKAGGILWDATNIAAIIMRFLVLLASTALSVRLG